MEAATSVSERSWEVCQRPERGVVETEAKKRPHDLQNQECSLSDHPIAGHTMLLCRYGSQEQNAIAKHRDTRPGTSVMIKCLGWSVITFLLFASVRYQDAIARKGDVQHLP
jgi:hypothetical protein